MSAFDSLQRRASDLGRAKWFRIAVASLFSVAILAVLSVVYPEASRLQRLVVRTPEVLRELNLATKDPRAVQFAEKGTIAIDGIMLGDAAFAPTVQRSFREDGRLERVSELSMALIAPQRPEWIPVSFANQPTMLLVASLLALVAVNFACFTGLPLALLGVTAASAGLGAIGFALRGGDLAASLAAIPAILLGFALLVRLLLMSLGFATPVFAVAGGVIREAVRLRIAVGFAAIAIVVIPLLPQWIDPTSPLRYQVQTYLSRSLDIMYVVCAFLTVFFGCATVAFEIRDRQAWMTLSKPVSRLSWLTGKWLGLVALNAAILTVTTLTMIAFLAQVRGRPAIDAYDSNAVRDEVLVARAGGRPSYEMLPTEELMSAVRDAVRSDPNVQADLREGRRTESEVEKSFARTIAEQYLNAQRSIGPQEERVYRFEGLGAAKDAGAFLTLRYRFYAGNSDPHELYPVIFRLGESETAPWVDRQFVAAQANILSIPPSMISNDGTLVIRIANVRYNPNAPPGQPAFEPGRASIMFDPDGLELLFKVGDFGPNLVRAQLVNLLKLSFVAMLAVTLSSFLSFPVACLVTFTIFAAGSLAPYLATSIDEYRIRTDSGFVKGIEAVVRGIASATEFSVRAFGEASASGALVEGRLVPTELVLRTLGLIGIAWSGVLLVVGFIVFRRKELAIYSGQGG